jgi:hypothetical protein
LFEEGQKADAYSDLYSLGVLVFEVVTGKLPFAAENQIALVAMHINKPPPSPRSLAPLLSVQTERVMLKALAKRPELRYPSATAFAEMFCESLSVRSEAGISSQMTRIEPAGASPYDTEVAPASSLLVNAPAVDRPMPPARATEDYPLAARGGSFSQAPVYQSQAMPVQRRSSPARTRGIVVGILALLALLAVIGPIVFASLTVRQHVHGTVTPFATHTVLQVQHTATATPTLTPTPNVTATAQAATATAVQQARQATVTAIAGQTATVQAQASATAGVIQTATAGNATYTDALNDPNATTTRQANWDQNQDGSCAFQSDGYHVSAKKVLSKGQIRGCMESGYSYTNATIAVDMTMLSGHAGGVFFRATADPLFHNYAGYLFALDSQGNYAISHSHNFSAGDVSLKEGAVPTGFKAGYNVKNTLQIIANGSSLSFYVNGVFLDKEADATFTSGNIAFFASSSDSGTDADVAYSNVRVFAMS